jgi:hypothetical protein
MKTKIETTKLVYITPEINEIKLDSEISLTLYSTPPDGPGETGFAPEYMKNDPFKNNNA